MTELRRRLIDVYSKGVSVDAVHQASAYQDLLDAHEKDHGFDRERHRVEQLRSQIDCYVGKKDSGKEQVEFALRLVTGLYDPGEREICRELVLRLYGAAWDEKLRQFFEQQSLRLPESYHYFLSFTNRNPNKPSLNQVNRNHKFFIIDTLGQPAYAKADLSARNLLADVVHYLLRTCQRKGFFYPEHEGDNQVVEKKLRDSCERALAFVQLVQAEMFQSYDETPNWCHFEYNVVQKRCTDIMFVQIDDKIDGSYVNVGLEPWYEAFAAKDSLRLDWTRWHDRRRIDENVKKISGLLAEQIGRAVERAYKGAPE